MSLKISTEPREDRQLALIIEVDQPRVDAMLRHAARKVAGKYRFPGFRQGKVPYHIVVQYVGLPSLYNEFVEDLGQEVYKEALEQANVQPYARASLEDVKLAPLTYTMLVPLEPEVALGDYRSLRVEPDAVEVDEAAVNARLEVYREEYARWTEVDRPSQYGDTLNIDIKSVIIPAAGAEGDAPTVVLNEQDWEVTPDEENPMEPPGLDKALVGMKPGEEKEFVLEWPAQSQSIHAGKEARFHVKVNSIKAYEKPALDDALAQLVGPDYATIDDLIQRIRETLRDEAERNAKDRFLDKALDALRTQTTLSYPPVVIEDQLDAMLSQYEQSLRRFGIEDLASYFEQTSQDLHAYRESLRERAIKIAENNLMLSELIKAEQLTVTDDEIEKLIAGMTGEADTEAGEGEKQESSRNTYGDVFRSGVGRTILEAQLLQDKAIERLLAIVRGEETPAPGSVATDTLPAEAVSAAEPAAVPEDAAASAAASG